MRKTMTIAAWTALMLLTGPAGWAEEAPNPDQEYIKSFLAEFPAVSLVPTLDAYATAARYDELYMGEKLDKAIEHISNDEGGLAWGLAYTMAALNEMYRATGDVKYLEAHRACIRKVLAATDAKLGKALWNGRVVTAWGSDKYAERGRAIFAVHTGVITAPILEFLLLAKANAAFSGALGDEAQTFLAGAAEALSVHDRQWRDGPGPGEGHYIGMDQENVLENKPLPGNRLSAMGWALWMSWKVSGNTTHRDRALALGRYVKNRLTLAPDGAYYWPYWLPLDAVTASQPREAVKGEDASHASLTLQLPLALAADGEVFTTDDLKQLAKTVTNGIARLGGGILLGDVTGSPKSKPGYVGPAARWLALAGVEPQVREPIVSFYLKYKPTPGPYELALLVRYGKPAP